MSTKGFDGGVVGAGRNRFGRLLRRHRMEAGLSLRRFAAALSLSAGYLSRVETGHEPPPAPARIVNMAEILSVNPDELLSAAGKLDPELVRYVCSNEPIVSFLREAERLGLKGEAFDRLTEELERFRPGRTRRARS